MIEVEAAVLRAMLSKISLKIKLDHARKDMLEAFCNMNEATGDYAQATGERYIFYERLKRFCATPCYRYNPERNE